MCGAWGVLHGSPCDHVVAEHVPSYPPTLLPSHLRALRYGTYGSLVEHDVLKSYPGSGLVSVSRVMIAVVVAFSYPLQVRVT